MPHCIHFWKPKPGVDPFLPAANPLGETIIAQIRKDGRSQFLQPFPASEMLSKLQERFPEGEIDEDGRFEWSDENERAISASAGEQDVTVHLWDMEIDDDEAEAVFRIAEEFGCEHYDLGN